MFPNRTTLALCIAVLLLSGCSSEGGTKPTPAPASTPPPPTYPPPPTGPCLAPITGDCVVTEYSKLTGGRQSDYALVVRGDRVDLQSGTYRFDGGTAVADEGELLVFKAATLESDVVTQPDSTLDIAGTVRGDITNNGIGGFTAIDDPYYGTYYEWEGGGLTLAGIVDGDVTNNGHLTPRSWGYIQGDFRQTAEGTLVIALPNDGELSDLLTVDGRADIEGGTLLLYQACNCWDFGSYPLPAEPVDIHVLHAGGGVFGQFDEWVSPGLFIEGSVRYETNDIWFDLSRASVAATMQANPFASGLTIASAGNIDAALSRADGYAGMPPPSLGIAQRQFLASASSLLWMQDSAQAGRALESLAGHAHAAMRDVLHGQVATAAARTDARLSALAYSTQPLAWSEPAVYASAGQYFAGAGSGFGQWLSPRLLVGGSIVDGHGSLHFDHLGGQGQSRSPAAGMHVHYRGDGWHATGLAGAQHSMLRLQRPIELGAAGTHLAHSQRVLDQAFVHGEVGRDWAMAGGTLTPFTALDYTTLHGDGFAEQGATGFELIGAPENRAQLSGTVGARYARTWHAGRPLRLDFAAGYRSGLADGGTPLRAAFSGVPDVWFDVPGMRQDDFAELRLGLAGSLGRRWDWSLDYAGSFGDGRQDDVWIGLQRAF